jgi:hypothetical protein
MIIIWYQNLNIQSSGHARQPTATLSIASATAAATQNTASCFSIVKHLHVYEKSPNLARMPFAAVIDQGKASAYYDSALSHLASRLYLFLAFLLHTQLTVIEVTSAQLIKSRWQAWGIKVRRS